MTDSPRKDVEWLSRELEDETGYDSIPTIERVYDGECVFPGCVFKGRDAEKMWRHVHFSRKHGLSFGKSFDALWEERTRSARD